MTILGNWKSPRIRQYLASNSDELVKEVTHFALTTDSYLAICPLLCLHGVGMPVASTILRWFHPRPFPILDFRALWSLGIEMQRTFDLEFWNNYVVTSRELMTKWNLDKRTFDRALWQFSKENQS